MILGTGGIPPDDLLPFDGSAPLLEEASPVIQPVDPSIEKSREAQVDTGIRDPRVAPDETVLPPDFVEVAFKYISDFCKASKAYALKKIPEWELFNRLDEGTITIDEWEKWPYQRTDSTAQSFKDPKDLVEKQNYRSQYVHSPQYLINSYVAHAYGAIFEGQEFLVVGLSPDAPEEMTEGPFPAPLKVQQVLINELKKGKIGERLKEALRMWVRCGPVYMKGYMAGDPGREYPTFKAIPLENCLVDPEATTADVQHDFRLMGHTVNTTYDDIIAGFKTGLYNVNYEAFCKQYGPDSGSQPVDTSRTVGADPDKADNTDVEPITKLTVWEVHGKVPTIYTDTGYVELVAALVSSLDADDPSEGILIKLDPEPYLRMAGRTLRPFPSAQFTPRNSPFGSGVLSAIHNSLFDASQSIGQVHDVGRLTANCGYLFEEGSVTAQELQRQGMRHRPGLMLPYAYGTDPTKALVPIPIGAYDLNAMLNHVGTVLNDIEKASLTDTFIGQGRPTDTATQANIQQAQSQRPVMSQLLSLAETLIKPLGEMALAMLFEYGKGPFYVKLRDPQGQMQTVPVMPQDLNPAWYTVDAALSRQDAIRTVRAQILQRVITEALPVIEPKIMAEGRRVDWSKHALTLYENLGFDQVETYLPQISTREQMMQQAMANMQATIDQMGQQMNQMAGALNAQQPANGNGNGGPPKPSPQKQTPGAEGQGQFGMNGGPQGPIPNDQNTEMQFEQMNPELHGNPYEQ